HELEAETAGPEPRHDIDVREVGDMAVRDRPREAQLAPVEVEPDDARRPVDELILPRTAPTGCPVRVVADEVVDGGPVDACVVAAFRTAFEVREVAGEPEQLELERERKRVEPRLTGAARNGVRQVEEAGQCPEGSLVRLLLLEQLQHRFGAGEPDAEPVPVLT